jgi:hypothetical protein
MITIPRADSLHPVKLGDLTFHFSPLLVWAEVDIMSVYQRKSGSVEVDASMAAYKAVKHCLKRLDGDIEYQDGTKFELRFDSQGSLTDECVTEVLALPVKRELIEHSFKLLAEHFAGADSVKGIDKKKSTANTKKKTVETS